ncbi:hypothetical protein HPB52_008918 [Rhipicephalus sanguineus]|uniref:Uncharacterized protein n=1 Tax=Rhipicephalus sanguineus TaxID=34632 RepID=A0A9D4SYJ3_RHISA|nr:hypothetical protein HPB52_008918 [Rhipicephalus sanguineus]
MIRGVDTDFDDAALNRMIIQPRNPSLPGARRIKNTATVILVFNGLKVPNYVYCGQVIYRCTLYKRLIVDTCGHVGHREDVCPTPSTKVCDQCGHLPTDNPHVCLMRRSTPHGRPRMPTSLPAALPGAPPSSAPSPTKANPAANTYPRTQPGSSQEYRSPRTSSRPTNSYPPMTSLPGPTRWQAKVRPAQRSDTCHINLTQN